MLRTTALIFVALLAALLPSPVCAQEADPSRDEEARLRFEVARRAHADGRYEEAYENYERAYELSGRHALLFNMGNVAERLRHDEDALSSYRRYLREVPDAANRPEVERRIEILQTALDARAADPSRDGPDVRPEAVAARSERASPPEDSPPEDPPPARRSVATRWWFWTLVGAAVVGTALGVGFALRGGTESPPSGFGPVVQAHQAF